MPLASEIADDFTIDLNVEATAIMMRQEAVEPGIVWLFEGTQYQESQDGQHALRSL